MEHYGQFPGLREIPTSGETGQPRSLVAPRGRLARKSVIVVPEPSRSKLAGVLDEQMTLIGLEGGGPWHGWGTGFSTEVIVFRR